MNFKPFQAILIFCILLIPVVLLSDIVYLKNGIVIKGKIVGQSRTAVKIRKTNGATIKYNKKDITKIIFRNETTTSRNKELERLRKAEEERKLEIKNKATLEKKRKAERKRKLSQKRRHNLHGPSKTSAFFRSLVLPGWGQYYQKRTKKAYIIGGAFLGSFGIAAYFDDSFKKSQGTYAKDVTNFAVTSPLWLSFNGTRISDTSIFVIPGLLQYQTIEKSRLSRDLSARNANIATLTFAGVYVWNLIDVVLFHPSKKQSVWLQTNNGGLGLGYSLQF